MKHLKPFSLRESESSNNLTQEQEDFLNQYTKTHFWKDLSPITKEPPSTWSINPVTGLVDVQGDFDCSKQRLKNLVGIKFGKVTGDFCCQENNLTSLVGAPQIVMKNFYCFRNQLTDLIGGPQIVGNIYDCSINNLTSLKGSPKDVRDLKCSTNNLTNLEGAPQTVKGHFTCHNNQLTSLKGGPKIVGNFICSNNPLTSLVDVPEEIRGKSPFSGFTYNTLFLSSENWNYGGWLTLLISDENNIHELIEDSDRKLVLTLPAFNAQFWLDRLKGDIKQDGQTLLQLAYLWDREGWEEQQARLQQELSPAQLRAIKALEGKLEYVKPIEIWRNLLPPKKPYLRPNDPDYEEHIQWKF
ncbi:hypothetical protein EBS02_09400 [bacterium]|nr:hypothetical protein [bacterium]